MIGLRITLGLHLDGQRAIEPRNVLGEATLGPLGLLDILETQLGLLADRPTQSTRIVQYRDCLSRANAEHHFYNRSFATDELGTASALLGWRDEWHLHGWSGEFKEGAPKRLSDMAAVEGLATGHLAPSIGERLAAVCDALAIRAPAIREVLLLDPLEAFPTRWRDVLAKLPVNQAAAPASGRVEGFLGDYQHCLRQRLAGEATSKLAWRDDGSLLFAQAETRLAGATWAARLLGRSADSLLVAEHDATLLDDGLGGAGAPRAGLKASSAFRPSLQLLPLAMELVWAPLNVHALLQFLTHPICPIPHRARQRLASKIADRPGIGGDAWGHVLGELDAQYGERALDVRQKIAFWIEAERFPSDGAPIAFVLERIDALESFFRQGMSDESPAQRFAHQIGLAQCRAAGDALRLLQYQGAAEIRSRQLQQLIDQATSRGTDNPFRSAEAGAVRLATHPGAVVEAADEVVWWSLSMPAMPGPCPWSRSELAALAAEGVSLPDSAERQAEQVRAWLRPVMAARKRLVMVLPPPGEEVHPLWQMTLAVLEKPPILPVEAVLSGEDDTSEALTPQPLPVARRWWRLPQDVAVPMRSKESYSSLELLIHNPYHWLLRYPAALKPSQLLSVGSEFRMLGNLAHALVEALYQREDALEMVPAAFQRWFDANFARLIQEEGALLLMPGRGSARESFRHALLRAVEELRAHLASAGVVRVEPERALSGHFLGGELAGFADLFIETRQRGSAIVDLKWAGGKKYPDVLKNNRHLQLAIYGELTRQHDGTWPSLAYFVINAAQLFAPDDRCFPNARVAASASGENAPQLWLRFIESWKWRKAQIDDGNFEVALDSIEPTEASVPAPDALAPETLNEAYNDYRVLAGWSE